MCGHSALILASALCAGWLDWTSFCGFQEACRLMEAKWIRWGVKMKQCDDYLPRALIFFYGRSFSVLGRTNQLLQGFMIVHQVNSFLHIFWVSIFSKLSRPLEPQLLFGSLSTQKPPGRWDTRWRLLMAVWKGICKGYGSKRKGLGTTAFGVFFLLPTGFCRYIIIPF